MTYGRDAASIELKAVPSESRLLLTDEYGLNTMLRVRDYLLDAADLKIGGVVTEPKAGDQIRETSGSAGDQVQVYEVMSPGGDEPAWRYSDAAQTQLRVHVKHVGTES